MIDNSRQVATLEHLFFAVVQHYIIEARAVDIIYFQSLVFVKP